jgi:hypothetical protein
LKRLKGKGSHKKEHEGKNRRGGMCQNWVLQNNPRAGIEIAACVSGHRCVKDINPREGRKKNLTGSAESPARQR